VNWLGSEATVLMQSSHFAVEGPPFLQAKALIAKMHLPGDVDLADLHVPVTVHRLVPIVVRIVRVNAAAAVAGRAVLGGIPGSRDSAITAAFGT